VAAISVSDDPLGSDGEAQPRPLGRFHAAAWARHKKHTKGPRGLQSLGGGVDSARNQNV